jgi:hypothetical protein
MLNRSGGWSGLLTVCAIWSEQRRHGRPPPAAAGLAEAAAPYGKTADVAAAELHAGDLLRLGRRRPGPRRLPGLRRPHTALVQISGGPRVHAMRAIEALGIPAMLGTGVTITSAGPRTREPVTVTVAAGGLEAAWERATTVVFTGQHASCTPDSGPGTGPAVAAADLCCGYTSFFTSRASATAWAHAHREVTGQVLDQASARQSGTQIFGPVLAGAG